MNFRLGEFREAKGLTQKELGKLIGKSTGTIQSWEYGDSYPNAEYVWKLCEFFGCDPNTLLGWYDEHPREDSPVLTHEERELVGCYRESTAERRKAMIVNARDNAAMSKDASDKAGAVDMNEAM